MEDLKLFGDRIIGNLERVIVGKSRSIELIVIGLLCQEAMPSVGNNDTGSASFDNFLFSILYRF